MTKFQRSKKALLVQWIVLIDYGNNCALMFTLPYVSISRESMALMFAGLYDIDISAA
jgi:hypothetical protein